MIMNQAFAHEQIYPHLHPHGAPTFLVDLFFSLLWLAVIAGMAFLLVRLGQQLIQRVSHKRDT